MLLPIHAAFGALARTIVFRAVALTVPAIFTLIAIPGAALAIPGAALAIPRAALAIPRGALAIPRGALAIPPRTVKFRTIITPLVARARETRTLVAPAIVARPVVALAPRLVVSAVSPAKVALVAAAFEFPVLKTTGGTRLVPVATWRTVVAIEASGALVIAVATRRVLVAAAERTILTVAAERPLVALAREAALFELLRKPLLPIPRGGTTLAARWSITPAAGSVVFVVVAGHEGLVSK
jgi:hypothetical protein